MASKSKTVKWQKVSDIKVDKDYSAGESSPYQAWVEAHGDGWWNTESIPESAGFWAEEDFEYAPVLHDIVQSLSGKQRKIVQFRSQGMSIERIAVKLGVAKSSVQSFLERLRVKALEAMKDYDSESNQ